MTFPSLPTTFCIFLWLQSWSKQNIKRPPLSIEEGEPMEFSKNSNRHKFDEQSSKDLKSSALPDMLAILVLCEGNAWQHGQYMPPRTTAFLRIYNACVVSVIQTIFYHVECKPPSCQNGKLKVLKPHVVKRCLRPSCNACLTANTGMVTSYKTCIWF